MANVNVKVCTLDVEKLLDRIAQHVQSVPTSLISQMLVTAIEDEIESEGRGRWEGFSPTTLKLHHRRKGGKLLQDTGNLASIQSDEGDDWAEAWSPAPYAIFHIFGATQDNIYLQHAPHRLPQRDFLDVELDEVLEEVVNTFTEEVIDW